MAKDDSKETPQTLEKSSIYIVATPIGNLGDISLRALEVLKNCDLIAAEDTRVTGKLLSLLSIKSKKLISFYDQIEQKKAKGLIEKVKEEGISLALVSDAGTPLISDPGYHLIKLAHEENIKVIPIPGASSLTSLVSASGLPSSRVLFLGFLPKKKNLIKIEMQEWKKFKSSIVFFESAKRVVKTIEILSEIYPESQVCIGRELTKKNETIRQDNCLSLLKWLEEDAVLKGELAVMISIPLGETETSPEILKEKIQEILSQDPDIPTREVIQRLDESQTSNKELYNLVLEEKKKLQEES